MLQIEDLEHMVAELRVLKFSLHDALFAIIFLRCSDHSLDGHSLYLIVVWRILGDFWRIRLACMTILPGVSRCGVEAGGFDRRFSPNILIPTLIDAEVLLERNEKACRSPSWVCLTLALCLPSLPTILAWLFPTFCLFDLFHFSCKVSFQIIA